MILIHLSVNGNSAMIDGKNILFAEECESKDENDKPIKFTRIYLKQPLSGDENISWIDCKESVNKLLNALK